MFANFNLMLIKAFKRIAKPIQAITHVGLRRLITVLFLSIFLAPITGTTFFAAAQKPALHLTKKEQTWLDNHKVIRVAVHHGWAPIEILSESGEFRGISVDYLNKVAALLNITFAKVEYAGNPALEYADMIGAISNPKVLENTKFVALDKPHFIMPLAIYTHKNNQTILNLQDLKGKKVAVFKRGQIANTLKKAVPNIQLQHVDIAEDAFIKIQNKTVDAYVGNQVVLSYIAYVGGFRSVKKVTALPYNAEIRFAVRDDWPELKSILLKANLVLAPERKEMLDNWDVNSQYKYQSVLFYIIGALSLIACAMLIRSYRLKLVLKKQTQHSQAIIWQQANYDFLTKLPNRFMFHHQLEQAIEESNRSQLSFALLFFDLDNFKHVNDHYGHHVGDKILIEIAHRLKKTARAVDHSARLGGDEFTLLIANLHDLKSVDRMCEKLLKNLEVPYVVDHHTIYMSCSIGITIYPYDATDVDSLLKFADQAMYEAKRLGKNRYQFFTPAMQQASIARAIISHDLRHAVSNNEFVLHYQPIVDYQDGTIHKAEALIRWQHPTKGFIHPAEFIPVAEETGIISQIGDWVFHQVLQDLQILHTKTQDNFQISLNTSPKQFHTNNSFNTWLDAMQQSNIAGRHLCIEITEGLLLEASETVKKCLALFNQTGIQVAIDDFGTGYSSLAYLKKFAVDVVKIDQSFVQNLETNPQDLILCEAIISMAHKLGIQVIAEGVETEAQDQILKTAGCNFAQGYLHAKPLSLNMLLERLGSQ